MKYCPFTDTATSQLLRDASTMDPDFSEWRDKPQVGDIDFGSAPEMAGQLLARKRQIVHRKKSGLIPADEEQEAIVSMAVLVSLAELEFLSHIKGLKNEKRLKMRSTGRIVMVANEGDK